METESGSTYQTWFDTEIAATGRLRRRKAMIFLKCIGITVVVAILVGIVGYLLEMNSNSDAGVIAIAAVMFVVPLCTIIMFFSMLPGFLKGSYKRKLNRAMKRMGLDEAGRERFARDQLSAQRDPSRFAALTLDGFGQDKLPARFAMGEHYACLIGGMNYGPYVVPLDGVESIRVRQHVMSAPGSARVFGAVINVKRNYTSYVVQFVGQGRELWSISLSDSASCKQVLDVLRQRFPVAAMGGM